MRPLAVLSLSVQRRWICPLLKNVLKYFWCTNGIHISTIRKRNVRSFVSLSSIIPFSNIPDLFFRQNEPVSLQNALPVPTLISFWSRRRMSRNFTNKDKKNHGHNRRKPWEWRGNISSRYRWKGWWWDEGVGVGAVSAHSPKCCSVQGLSWDAVWMGIRVVV